MSTIFKITTVGDAGVGKTTFSLRFVKSQYVEVRDSTIGSAFLTKKINSGTIQIWDTAGQERFHSLVPMYLRDADCVIYMFDLTDLDTLENIFKIWIPVVERITSGKNCVYYIVGTKQDLNQNLHNNTNQYYKKMINSYAKKYCVSVANLKFYQTSSVTGQNVELVFENIIDDIDKIKKEIIEKSIETVKLDKNGSIYSCC